MKQLLKKLFSNNNILSLMGNGSAAALGFISFALLARSLQQKDFGNWVIFVTIYTLFELLRVGFLQTPLIKFSSGTSKEEHRKVLGTSWVFAWIITGIIAVLSLLIYFSCRHLIGNEGVLLFLKWFGLLSIFTLPFNFASWILQSDLRFDKILYIRWISLGSFVVMLIFNLFLNRGLNFVVFAFLASNLLASIICIGLGWTKIHTVKYFSRKKLRTLINFGKFSMGTMLGANLLRSSATLLIGAFLGPAAVAMYSVPLKLFEIIEIPLRSFVATALPELSRLFNTSDLEGLKAYFEKSTGMFSLLMIPLVLICLLFAEPMVILLGGIQYIESANLLRIFSIFAFFMPLDRYSGITLDIMNRPVLNFIKVIMMLIVNAGGNVVVLYLAGKLWPVAVVSIFTFLTGVLFGAWFLKKYLKFSIKRLLINGFYECRTMAIKIIRASWTAKYKMKSEQ